MKLKRTCIYLSALVIVMLVNIVQVKAQGPGLPCGDPDIDCPIDTPVLVLVAVVLLLSVKKLLEIKSEPKQPIK